FNLRRLLGGKSRVVLMGVGAVLLAIAALQGTRMIIGEREVAEVPAIANTVANTQTASISPADTAPVDVQAARVIEEDAVPGTAQSVLATPPETPAEVTTSWLDAPADTQDPTVPAALAEIEAPDGRDELTLAAIPL